MTTIASSDSLASLVGFRSELYSCLPRLADALFELCDATLRARGRSGLSPNCASRPSSPGRHGSLCEALALASIDEHDPGTRSSRPSQRTGRSSSRSMPTCGLAAMQRRARNGALATQRHDTVRAIRSSRDGVISG